MNLFDSKKKLGIAGVIMGLVAATLAYFGNPAVARYSFVAIEIINAPRTIPMISGLAYCTGSAEHLLRNQECVSQEVSAISFL